MLNRGWQVINFSRLSCLLLALLLTSCTYFEQVAHVFSRHDLQKPTIELVDVKYGKISVFNQKLMVKLKVSNPNDVEIPISSLSCTLELEDFVAANGMTTEPFVVPALGNHEFVVVVSTSLFKISGPVAKLLKARKKSVNYRVSGRVKVDILFVGPFSFQQKGEVVLER